MLITMSGQGARPIATAEQSLTHDLKTDRRTGFTSQNYCEGRSVRRVENASERTG